MSTCARTPAFAGITPALSTLAFLSIFIACSPLASAQAPNVSQFRQQVLQQQQQVFNTIQQQRQIHSLMQQIGQLQVQSINLTMQINEMSKQYQSQMPPAPQPAQHPAGISPTAQPSELTAAIKAADNAKNACDRLRQKLLAAAQNTNEYKQAKATLESDQASRTAARAETADPDSVAALANKVLADETLIAKLEQQALDASPEWAAASAALLEKNKSLAALRDSLDQPTKINPNMPGTLPPANARAPQDSAPATSMFATIRTDPQGLSAQIRDLTAQRNNTDAQGQALMQQLASISSYDAQLVAQQGEGTREELTQLYQQQQQQIVGPKSLAGAPLIHFSPQVSPQVQQYIQGNLDEAQRMKDPVYAAEKQKEAQEEAARQQQAQEEADKQQQEQQQEEQQRQQEEQQRESQGQ